MRVRVTKVPSSARRYDEGGLIEINNGGTHEENPMGGVPMGVGQNGKPNLVEEGETIYSDYVFSKRLKPNDKELKAVGLPVSLAGKSYAEISKRLGKESSERINDRISHAGLMSSLTKLRKAQDKRNSRDEAAKQRREAKKQAQALAIAEQAKAYEEAARAKQIADMLKDNANVRKDGGPVNVLANGIYYGNQDANNDAYKMTLASNETPSSWLMDYSITDDGIVSNNPEWQNYNNYILSHWNDEDVQKEMGEWWKMWKEKNSDSDLSKGNLSQDLYKKLSQDKKYGYGHLIGVGIKNLYEKALQQAISDKEGIEAEKAKQDFLKDLNTNKTDKNNLSSNGKPKLADTSLRYAPIAGNLAAAAELAANGVDHSISDAYLDAASAIPRRTVSFNPTADYLAYRPMDTDYQANRYAAQANAGRQALMQQAAATGSGLAAILANNVNVQQGLGDLYNNALEYNNAQRQATAKFNQETNQFNSTGMLDASKQNAALGESRDALRANMLDKAFDQRDAENTAYQTARSSNMTQLFNNLGGIGRENFNSNMVASNPAYLYSIGRNGQVNYNGVATGARGGELMTTLKKKKKRKRK